VSQPRHVLAHQLHLVFGEVLQNVRAGLLAQGNEKDGRFLQTAHSLRCRVQDHCVLPSSSIQPRSTLAAKEPSLLTVSFRCSFSASVLRVVAGALSLSCISASSCWCCCS